MQIRPRLEAVIEEMLDGKAFTRNKKRITNTADALGIHRNTISKRVNSYREQERARHTRQTNHKISQPAH